MSEPDDAAAVLGDLDRHALAHAPEAAQLMMGEQLEIPAHALRRALVQRTGSCRHSRLHLIREQLIFSTALISV
jgi:hypothetical protein